MKKNKGYSLVELLVAITIMSIVGIAVFSFMTFGSKAFSSTSKSVKLQYEQQIAVNQIKDRILEASYGVSYDDVTDSADLYIFSENEKADVTEETRMRVDKISYNEVEKRVYLSEVVGDPKSSYLDVVAAVSDESIEKHILAENVTAFKVLEYENNLKENKLMFEISFDISGKTATVTPVVAFRNKVIDISELTNLEKVYKEKVIELVKSYIESITISRKENDVVIETFAQGGADTILHAGKAVSAQYVADITAVKNSLKKYKAVSWSIEEIPGGGDISGIAVSQSGRVTIPAEVGATKFTLIATSMDDSDKSASITINIGKTGKWAKAVALKQINNKENVSYPLEGNGTLTFMLDATVTYDVYEDGVKKADVTEPTDPTKSGLPLVRVTVLDPDKLIGAGAGFNSQTGAFVATKSMENHTFTFVVEAKDLGVDENGNSKIIRNETFQIAVGHVPDALPSPYLAVSNTSNRGGSNGVSIAWKENPPFSYYDIDWEISEYIDENGNSDWVNDNEYKSFKNVTFEASGTTNDGHKYSSDNNSRFQSVKVNEKLDWNKDYRYNVTAVIKEKVKNEDGSWKKNGDSDYFRRLTATQVVTIKRVEVILHPTDILTINYNNNPLTDVINTKTTIGLGKDHNPAGITICDPKNNYNPGNVKFVEQYYKLFDPELIGLTVNSQNFSNVFSVWGNNPEGSTTWNRDCVNIADSSFRPYYFSGSTKLYYTGERAKLITGPDKDYGAHTIFGLDNKSQFFIGIVLEPNKWIKDYMSPRVYGLEYKLTLKGKNTDSFAECKFVDNKGVVKNYMEYTVVNNNTAE